MEVLARAVFGLEGTGCEGYAVAFGSEDLGGAEANVFAGADDEGDWFGHCCWVERVGVGRIWLLSGRVIIGDIVVLKRMILLICLYKSPVLPSCLIIILQLIWTTALRYGIGRLTSSAM
jgi:hypothetical protein